MNDLHTIQLNKNEVLTTQDKVTEVTYQIFGLPIGFAPVVLVNHALTGNSNVAGEKGWWNSLIGKQKVIDIDQFTVICFNIPGNGYDNEATKLITNYKQFSTRDIALIFWQALEQLGVTELFAVIGGSLGGGIAWEMGFLRPKAIKNIIPVATNYKANDWLIGNVLVQDQILNNSVKPIHDARLHAMLLYRTPQSLQSKFKTEKKEEFYQIESWLLHHGNKLENRFTLQAYKLMNHLLKTIGQDITESDLIAFAKETDAKIHQIAINTDYFFIPQDNKAVHEKLQLFTSKIQYSEIDSIHGHDAFLIEFEQLNAILAPVFKIHNN